MIEIKFVFRRNANKTGCYFNVIISFQKYSRCEWNGEECDWRNFTTKITDYGLCYMFNSGGYISTDKTGKTLPLRSNRTGTWHF